MALTVPPSSPNNATIPTSLASGDSPVRAVGEDTAAWTTTRSAPPAGFAAARSADAVTPSPSSRDEGKQAQDSDQGEREGEHLSPQQPILVGLVVVVLVADAGRLIEATGG